MIKYKNLLAVRQYGKISVDSSEKFLTIPVRSLFDWAKNLKPARPISAREVEEIPPEDKYLKQFESRKGFSADVMNSVDIRLSIQELFTVEGVKEYFRTVKLRRALISQRYIDARVNVLGPDLAAAHFVIFRGGKVRFKGEKDWVQRNEDWEYNLPKEYDASYMVEELDVSEMHLMYDGLQNFEQLKFLKSFKACKSPLLNDWCMDRISHQFADTIEELDISHCPEITGRGLEVVVKLRNLKLLKLEGLEHIENLKLITLLIEECKPNLKIEGVSI